MTKYILLIFIYLNCIIGQHAEMLSTVQTLGSNPLKGFKIFSVSSSIPAIELQNEIYEEILTQLNKIGKVEKLEISSRNLDKTIENLAVLGNTEGKLTLAIRSITPDDTNSPIIEASLFLKTPTIIKKTGVDSISQAWATSTFVQGIIDSKNAQSILSAVRDLFERFVRDYQSANKESRPMFYVFADKE